MNATTLFAEHARRTPGAPALAWNGGMVGYGELEDRVRRAAAAFVARGIGAASRVAILLPNDPAFAVALLAALWVGATAVVLSPAWSAADVARALADADAELLVTTPEGEGATADVGIATLVVEGGSGRGSFERALAAAAPSGGDGPVPVSADADATILYSSGTTGNPRGVVLTHGNLVFNARSKVRYCGIGPADVLALVVPVSHCFGQNVVLLGALAAGASVRMYLRLDPERLRDDVARGEVSMLLAAPAAFQRMLDLGADAALRRLRYSLSAAAPLRHDLAARWWQEVGHPLAQGYGLTECSPFATYDDGAGLPGTVGRAIDGVQVRVGTFDGDGWVPDGMPGEIAIRGPNVMRGYWRRPEDTARALRGGWLRTRDAGRLDEAGRLTLIDRLDDVINVAGFKAYPSDVERALAEHPAVKEVAAFGLADRVRGSRVAAAVVLRPGRTADSASLMGFAAARLAGFQRPTELRIVDELPRSPSGKVLRRVLSATVDSSRI